MNFRNGLLYVCCLLFSVESNLALAETRRFALAAGFNDGGADRSALRYAVSDAESFARVMETLGGVDASDLVLLKQPSLIELEDAETGETITVDTADYQTRQIFDQIVKTGDQDRDRLFKAKDLDTIPVGAGEPYERSLIRFFNTRSKRAR